ncbi:MAG TPA: YdeI/OmpD-associated family protein [Coriobacteriia bacterium]|nr:YdeI/OmpD-associated family protein [Coriobacteriia bacterium]
MTFKLRTYLDVPRKGWLYLYIPDELLGGVRRRVWIEGTLNGMPFTATANPWKDQTHVVTVNRHMRRTLGIDGPVEVELEARVSDEPLLDIEIPADLHDAITSDPSARATFEALAPSHQKEFVLYLDDASIQATRDERIRKSVAVLRRGGHMWENPAEQFAEDLRGA